VFLASTTRGTVTDAAGRFRLNDVPPGFFQLTASRVGYESSVLRIDYAGETEAHRNYVRLAQGLVHAGPDGSLREQQDFLIDPSSWWAQHRVGRRMLPLEYVPD